MSDAEAGSILVVGARDRLRRATRDLHERAEGSRLMRPFIEGGFGRDDYRRLLSAYTLVFSRIDVQLQGPATLPYRPRLPALLNDLARLDAMAPVTPCRPPPAALAGPVYWGCRYVVEGMLLGGAVLRRQLDQSADDRCRQASRFLSLPSTDWPLFCRHLDRVLAAEDDLKHACLAACETFGLILAHLDKPEMNT